MPNGSKVVGFERVFRVTVIVPSHSGIAERITEAILKHDRLCYGNMNDQVAFESAIGGERFRPIEVDKSSDRRRSAVPSIELSFTLPRGGSKDATHLREVLDAIVEVHPWEEPQIFVQEVLATRTQKSA